MKDQELIRYLEIFKSKTKVMKELLLKLMYKIGFVPVKKVSELENKMDDILERISSGRKLIVINDVNISGLEIIDTDLIVTGDNVFIHRCRFLDSNIISLHKTKNVSFYDCYFKSTEKKVK